MSRQRLVLIGLVFGAVAVGGLALLNRDDGPKTRADYCNPPEQIETLPEVSPDPDPPTVAFDHLATIDDALAMAERPDGRLLVATKTGGLWQVPHDGGGPKELLDLTSEVATGTEQGLLGVAVDPKGEFAYLHATFDDGRAGVFRYRLTDEGLDVESRADVFIVDDPAPEHNAGHLAFDDEGMLFIALGDGGNGDRTGAAQDLGSPFGKLLRIDPRPGGDRTYRIPPDNPFVDTEGALGEIWSLGFRNPWGWGFDRVTGDLWVGDVGHLCFEEVSVADGRGRGDNFGWSHLEGAHEFRGPVLGPGGEPIDDADIAELGALPARRIGPVLEYQHSDTRCTVLGGYVYRGDAVPELAGRYLWADLCERAVHTLHRDGEAWQTGVLGGEIPRGIVAFGEGRDAELYVLSLTDGIYRVVPV